LFGSYFGGLGEGGHNLSCFRQNDSLLFKIPYFNYSLDCDHLLTGISEIESAKSISIFPNPASTFITFDLSNFPNEKFTLTIYNSSGQQVNHYSNLHSSQLTIPVSQLGADGLYFYTVSFDDENLSRFSVGKFYSGKFLVQR
jgi:hypothetical protein